MKFFKELLNYDMKSDQSLKTRLYQMYILEIESKLGIPLAIINIHILRKMKGIFRTMNCNIISYIKIFYYYKIF